MGMCACVSTVPPGSGESRSAKGRMGHPVRGNAAAPASHHDRRGPRNTRDATEPSIAAGSHLAALTSEAILDAAYAWLCRRRRHYAADADIWSFRRQWSEEKTRIRADLLTGRYTFSLLERITRADGEEFDLWAARDALVLKALAMVMATRLPRSRHCTHLKGHGGSKGAVRTVLRDLPVHRCVLKTDVRKYYASIDHHRLLERLAP